VTAAVGQQGSQRHGQNQAQAGERIQQDGDDQRQPASADGSDQPGIDRGRSRVFWQYWTAWSISSAGDAVTTVALPLVAVELLGASSFQVGLLTAASYLAWLLIGLPAGVLVHRLPLRGAQVTMDLIRAGALASVPVVAWAGGLTIAQLLAVAFVVGLATVVASVGNSTLLPALVSKEDLTARNSLMSATDAVTQLGGPSIGGGLVQLFGAPATLLADVVSYLVSAVLFWRLPRPAQPEPARQKSIVRLIADGCRYVAAHPIMRPCTVAAIVANFVAGGLMTLTPVFVVRTLGAPAWLYGLVVASEGVGALIGAALTPRIARILGSARAVWCALAGGAVVALMMPLAGHGWGIASFALGSAGLAAGIVTFSVLTRTYRQTASPPELFPRVMATVRFISWGAIPFGALTAGAIAAAGGNRTALWIICGLNFLSPVILVTSRVRRHRDLPTGADLAPSGP
jgi:MFS family permease